MFTWSRFDESSQVFIGILNITPDSFSDGGRYLDPEAALKHAEALIQSGALIIDIGAESTRPKATPVDPENEWNRLEKVLPQLIKEFGNSIPFSLDTRHSAVALRGIDEGVTIINDVTGFLDPAMCRVLSNPSVGAIAMRSTITQGSLEMPLYTQERNDLSSRLDELKRVSTHLNSQNINPDRILLDPGFGFGTTYAEDLSLWKGLREGLLPQWPLSRYCVGLSRKRFVKTYQSVNQGPDTLDQSSHELIEELITFGYRFFRVHAIPRYS